MLYSRTFTTGLMPHAPWPPCSCLVLGAATTAVLLGAREGILQPFHLAPPVYALARPYWSLLSPMVPLVLLNMAVSGTLQVGAPTRDLSLWTPQLCEALVSSPVRCDLVAAIKVK